MAILFGAAEPFVNFSRGHYEEHELETVVQEEMSFKENVYGRRTDWQSQ